MSFVITIINIIIIITMIMISISSITVSSICRAMLFTTDLLLSGFVALLVRFVDIVHMRNLLGWLRLGWLRIY